jgi:triosephosphate isomerase
MSRKKIIAANWKMYKTPELSRRFMEEFVPLVAGHTRDEIVICPPFVDIAVRKTCIGKKKAPSPPRSAEKC